MGEILFSPEHRGLHKLTNNMPDHDVTFLNTGCICGRHIEQDVC